MPSPDRARAAAAPALLVFWNLPQVGARGRMGRERKGEGSGGHALCTGGATRSRRSSHRPESKGKQPGHPCQRVPTRTSPPLRPTLPLAPGPVTSPGWPSPTDSEVKRNVPSSMNASWKPLSCPFMLVSVTAVSNSGVE